MKTNPSRLLAAAALLAGVIFVHAIHTANAQQIDPATGQPVVGAASATHIDPLTGLQVSNKDGKPVFNNFNSNDSDPSAAAFNAIIRKATAEFNAITSEAFSNAAALDEKFLGHPLYEVRELVANGQYAEALTQLQLYHSQRKDTKSFMLLLSEWFEMGKKFPKAREALIEIRDDDVGELSNGRGDADLFWEAKLINGDLNQDDATCTLFKTIDGRDKQLAAQCYPYAEDLLVQKGEYGLCLNYLGDPQARFESVRTNLENQRIWIPKLEEIQRKSQQDLAERLKQSAQTEQEWEIKAQEYRQERQRELQQFRQELWKKYPESSPPSDVTYAPISAPAPRRFTPPPFTPPDIGKMATNNFVRQVGKLVEILVATDHKTDAEKIRDEAVTILEDSRLQSAVADAEERIHHKPAQMQK